MKNTSSFLVLLMVAIGSVRYVQSQDCGATQTKVSGSNAPTGQICSGQLILNEQFDSFNTDLWKHEAGLSGSGNGEFEWYTDNTQNSFVQDGKLYIRPTLTSDFIGEAGLTSALVTVDNCTDTVCSRQGTTTDIINPIRSARLRTAGSFSFTYGRLEVTAKLPTGDWLWPAIWLLPTDQVYGTWPRSGEIDLLESRGNLNYVGSDGAQIGAEQIASTLHFGPAWNQDAWNAAHYQKNSAAGNGYDKGFHKYQLEWTPTYLKFSVDDQLIGNVEVGSGFWALGGFQGDNIWTNSNSAPFDQNFHIIFNLAVGGTNGYFPDTGNQGGKPWRNSAAHAATDFWNGRDQWLSGWNLGNNNSSDASLIVDSIQVWAL